MLSTKVAPPLDDGVSGELAGPRWRTGRVAATKTCPNGPIVEVQAGDVALLPAGTGYKRVSASANLLVVGAYPSGQSDYDLLRGDASEVERARETIAAVRLPETDPVAGKGVPVAEHWAAP